MNIKEAASLLQISEDDMKSICDLNLIKHNNYDINTDDLSEYMQKRISSKNRYIPIPDKEMMINDKWEEKQIK